MEEAARDTTQDWLLPEGSVPPLLGELEQRIDEALVIARASEKVAIEVGDAALEAAGQARRAAELAERATAAVLAAGPPESPARPASEHPPVDIALHRFTERADRVVARLRALERRPRGARPASGAVGLRRPAG